MLRYLTNLLPTSLHPSDEPAVAVSYATAVLTYVIGYFTAHGWLSGSLSTDAQQYIPLAAAVLVAALGHLIRPLVSALPIATEPVRHTAPEPAPIAMPDVVAPDVAALIAAVQTPLAEPAANPAV